MDDIKKNFPSFLDKYKNMISQNANISFYWKAIIMFYMFIFLVLIVLGWLLYSWAITSQTASSNTKISRPEITLDEVNKVKEITEGRNEKLELVITNDVTAIEMK